MKQSIILSAVAVVLSFSSVFAQSQNANVETSLPSLVSANSVVMSTNQIDAVRRSAITVTLREQAGQFAAMTAKMILPTVTSNLKAIENGGTNTYSVLLASKSAQTLSNQNRLQVHVTYEPRPIGGILNVTVDLVPQFAGVGVAARPIASKSMATAVDSLNATNVNTLVGSLSVELASEISGPNGNYASN